MERLPLLVSLLMAPGFAQVAYGAIEGTVRESGAAVAKAPATITETQANNVLTGGRRLNAGLQGKTRMGRARTWSWLPRKSLRHWAASLKTEFREKG